MVRIVTGKIDSGKTSRLLEIFRSQKKGDGIIAKKYMIGKAVFGFNAFVLSSESEFPYMIHEKQLPENHNFDKKIFSDQIGPYLVYGNTERFIDGFFADLIEKKVSPLYFDEVGKLELSGKGYMKSIKNALASKLDIYLGIREDLVSAVMDALNISDYEIVSR